MTSGSGTGKFSLSRSHNLSNSMITIILILAGLVLVTGLDSAETTHRG